MSLYSICVQAFLFISILPVCAPSGGSSESRLRKIIMKQEALHRSKRNVWDRSRPDVQQWIQQFMYMGYDEARLETDLSYWMDQARSHDQGRQHHHDENAPMSQQDPSSYRHGANVNYDYY
ncbi:augurin-B isoform X2 [Myxocyprinus asiaticus]|uniref:augurin-B isoform X2 n=1 Tax=Myxocyprinus asiaticus TaxID=70543 RepID=UPI002223497D|nr:augurin-B isoform X2 [Myxocyprinus asiaticus]